MNILFVTIGALADLGESSIYSDLLRCFQNHGHSVCVVCQREKRTGLPTQITTEYGIKILRVQTGNITKVGMLEKGISTLLIGSKFKRSINKYFSKEKFDIVLYSTPPITIAKTIKFIKQRDNAYTYLMLKDIFPQNAVDIGVLNKKGLKGIIYRYFRTREKHLYRISDYIGCMSNANVNYIRKNNPYISDGKVGICPNTIDIIIESLPDKCDIKDKLNLPKDKILFIYGGNFGKPQCVNYIINILKSNENKDNCHFIMCGSGTDFYKIKNYVNQSAATHVTIIDSLNKDDYGQLLDACDVGLLFLDYRFTIPNFPSRMLDYMNHNLPILASTDENTDVGKVIVDNGFGWWCLSDKVDNYNKILDEILLNSFMIKDMGIAGKRYLKEYYETIVAYKQIMNAFKKSCIKNLEESNYV